ncbi:MAG: hypothetical protein AB7O43_21190 [Hyphomicrobiaceae bacterium]
MAFEDIEAEIGILLSKLTDHPQDKHELSMQLAAKLNELRAFGMPLPQDLVELEAALEQEFEAQNRSSQKEDG